MWKTFSPLSIGVYAFCECIDPVGQAGSDKNPWIQSDRCVLAGTLLETRGAY